ncbi:MAG: phytanoyl-CoA dioxygenase family protein [Fuerstiella sp.]|nr:phytanoyl-CoA dioxygenase family protein [Fuerstiella sp.]
MPWYFRGAGNFRVFYKPAHVGGPALPHQDNAYFNFLPPYGFVVWIALDQVTLANGAVHFSRGWHRLGQLPHNHTGNPRFGRAVMTTPDPTHHPETPVLLNPGDASLHHFLTVHRSGPNRTDHNRRGFVMDYRAGSAEPDQNASAEQEAYKENVFKQFGVM